MTVELAYHTSEPITAMEMVLKERQKIAYLLVY